MRLCYPNPPFSQLAKVLTKIALKANIPPEPVSQYTWTHIPTNTFLVILWIICPHVCMSCFVSHILCVSQGGGGGGDTVTLGVFPWGCAAGYFSGWVGGGGGGYSRRLLGDRLGPVFYGAYETYPPQPIPQCTVNDA